MFLYWKSFQQSYTTHLSRCSYLFVVFIAESNSNYCHPNSGYQLISWMAIVVKLYPIQNLIYLSLYFSSLIIWFKSSWWALCGKYCIIKRQMLSLQFSGIWYKIHNKIIYMNRGYTLVENFLEMKLNLSDL